MNQSGGFFYHYLALRNSLSYWRSYRKELGLVMADSGVLEIGPCAWVGISGAYSLESHILRPRVSEDLFIDTDPFAKLIFKLKFPKSKNWIVKNFFCFEECPLESARKTAESFNQLGRPLVFCNILGQLPLVHTAPDAFWEVFHPGFIGQLDVPVFSYHDRFTVVSPKAKALSELSKTWSGLPINSEEDLMGALQNSSLNRGEVSFVDHLTSALSPHGCGQVLWRKDPSSLHLIDCISKICI